MPRSSPAAVVQSVKVPLPDEPRSAAIWRHSLAGHVADPGGMGRRAGRPVPAAGGADHGRRRARRQRPPDPAGARPLTLADVAAACRQQANQNLGELAVKVQPVCGWDDLVLPEDRLEQLRDICAQVRHHYRVYGDWGFGAQTQSRHGAQRAVQRAARHRQDDGRRGARRASCGSTCTRSTCPAWSASTSARPRRTWPRIFAEAETGNAILFFDEADALFGKRTEVSDAHDRYANIETSYLLQRMEEYEGVVILATNLRQNMDEAFTRRLRFVVEFPFPDGRQPAADLARRTLPPQAPVAADVDLGALAREFQVAGGSIRNIVLNAAFLAAADGGVIDRRHVLRGARREFEKIGKLWNDGSVRRAVARSRSAEVRDD